MGVFATRATHRPNGIGLSAVKLDQIEHSENNVILHVSGLDLIDGTPVIDIKPYIPYSDQITHAKYPFAQEKPNTLGVIFSEQALSGISDKNERLLIEEILAQDPRPAFHELDQERIYGAKILDRDIRWQYVLIQDQITINVLSADIFK